MSPVSKKRKKSGGRRRAPESDSVGAHLASIAQTMRSLRLQPDPLDAEAYASQLVADLLDGDDPARDTATFLTFTGLLTERGGPAFLALGRVLSHLAPSASARAAARDAADEIALGGTPEPRWLDSLGESRMRRAHAFADVYGDQVVLICRFDGAGRDHALIAFLNLTHPGGFLHDLILATAPDKALDGFSRHAAERTGLVTLTEIDVDHATSMLAAALTESHRTLDVPESVVALRPLLGARLAAEETALDGGGNNPHADDGGDDPHAGDDLVTMLTVDAPRRRFAILDGWREFGERYDAGRVDRLSPTKIEAFAEVWNGPADEAATALRDLFAAQAADGDYLTPTARDHLQQAIAQAFPSPTTVAVDTSWIDELTGTD